MTRELVVLGTASQVPTRERNHNGYLLRWDGLAVLFDPGEGTQRQLTRAGESTARLRHVAITHAHGDHCLGLPGVLQRLSLDGVQRPVTVHHPAAAATTIERLATAVPYEQVTPVVLDPAEDGDVRDLGDGLTMRARELSHVLPTLGWRIDEPDGWRLLPERLEVHGIHGPARAELRATGVVRVDDRVVRIEEVAVPRPGLSVAFVMDTRDCEGARDLADGVDLLVIEATFLSSEGELADEAGHLTAAHAATIAREAGARRTVLTHLSQRYPTLDGHRAEAAAAAPGLDLHVASDLDRIPVPRHR